MRADLRYLHSPDVPDLQSYIPANSELFGILIQAFIGPSGAEGEESFEFVVCTPRWLEAQLVQQEFIFGASYLVISKYSYELIWRAIYGICSRTYGPDWNTIGNKLAKYGSWEFDDYIPGPSE